VQNLPRYRSRGVDRSRRDSSTNILREANMSHVTRLYEMTPRELEEQAKRADECGDIEWAAACREEIELLTRIASSFSASG
jgi:hypothetical protein